MNIYSKGFIYEGYKHYTQKETINNITETYDNKYPVQGNHSFKDEEDVTGRYGIRSALPYPPVAYEVPLPTPPVPGDVAEAKAKELWQKFGKYFEPKFSEEHKLMQKEKQRRLVLDVIDEIIEAFKNPDNLPMELNNDELLAVTEFASHAIKSYKSIRTQIVAM